MVLKLQGGRVSRSPFKIIHRQIRDECLNINWLMSLLNARDKIERWRNINNSNEGRSTAISKVRYFD